MTLKSGRSPTTRRGLLTGIVASAGLMSIPVVGAAPARGQTYPSRPITLVVGLAPGSGQDAAAHTVSRRAGELLGVQIVVENKPGAGTMTASLSVAKAPPDGYTLLQNGVALSVNPSLYKSSAGSTRRSTPPCATRACATTSRGWALSPGQ